MLHGKAANNVEDKASGIKTKIGLWMFLLYTIVYFGFIIVTVTKPELMGKDIGHLNVAIVYGLGLIVFALILALIYNALCNKYEKELNTNDETATGEIK
jgi:uncharacterized membrane protein (DUF485 family)